MSGESILRLLKVALFLGGLAMLFVDFSDGDDGLISLSGRPLMGLVVMGMHLAVPLEMWVRRRKFALVFYSVLALLIVGWVGLHHLSVEMPLMMKIGFSGVLLCPYLTVVLLTWRCERRSGADSSGEGAVGQNRL